ncbi:MAG: PspA/IM30 family protein [Bacteroidota bacterium]|jgi:phage shock protein A|nr:PspA/IM30 family protein [Bacteroidota bacterium]
MAGIFARISDIFKANINDLLDKAEDPEKMIKQMVLEMEEAVNKATTAVGSAIANEKMLEKQHAEKKKLAADWHERAVKAVNAGRDDLARQALEKKNMFDKAATDLEMPLAEAQQTATTMRSQLDQLKVKLDEARVRQGTLIARHQAAKAKKQISSSLAGIGDGAFANFDKYEQKVLKAESEAEAMSQIAGDSTSLDEEFKKLEAGSSVEEELALLKAAANNE